MDEKATRSFSAVWATCLALAMLYGPAAVGATTPLATQSLTLGWTPSPSTNVAGYHIYYGSDGTNFQYEMDAGTNTIFEVSGLQEGETNSFVVTAYDAQGVDSAPSNLITYVVPGTVNIASKAGAGSPAIITFPVVTGYTYQVQASVNLITWSNVWQTTATSNGWIQFEDSESTHLNTRFYRLAW
jgi:fibronectin type 3 domain-containing protein